MSFNILRGKALKLLLQITLVTASLATLVRAANAEQINVVVNHAPASFREVLSELDIEHKFRFSDNSWFALDQADAWVYFLNPETDLYAAPELVGIILGQTTDSTGDLTRLTATLENGKSLTVQIVDFSKEIPYGPQYRGCFAALDLAFMAYPELVVAELRNEVCLKYGEE